MAQRRMFSRTITESDAFTEMPLSAQALYFHLGLNADDDGFVNSPKHVQRGIGAAEDDLAILVAKRFLIPFDSGVVVIRHWKTNNYIRHDRYKPTECVEEALMLSDNGNGVYVLDGSASAPPAGIPTGTLPGTEAGIPTAIPTGNPGKDRLGKDRVEKDPLPEKAASIAAEAVDHLNRRAGCSFKATSRATVRHVRARVAEGYGIEDFKRVIDTKATQWENDPNMSRYLRPETLFGPKFESYLNETPCKEVHGYDKYED